MKKSVLMAGVLAAFALAACGDGGADGRKDGDSQAGASSAPSAEAPAPTFGAAVTQLPADFSYQDANNRWSTGADYFSAEVGNEPMLFTADGAPTAPPEGTKPIAWYVNDEGVFLLASRAGSGLTAGGDVLAKVDPADGTTLWEVPAEAGFELRDPSQVLVFEKALVIDRGSFVGVDLSTGKARYTKLLPNSVSGKQGTVSGACVRKEVAPTNGAPEAFESFDALTGGTCAEPFDPSATLVKDGVYSTRYDLDQADAPEGLQLFDEGRLVWTLPGATGEELGQTSSEVIVANKENGVLAALALSDGKRVAEATVTCPEEIGGQVLNDERMILTCETEDDVVTVSIVAV